MCESLASTLVLPSWHTEVYKAAKLNNEISYDAEYAVVDAIIIQTSSLKLHQRAIQENPLYKELMDLGISQVQKKKWTKMPDGDSKRKSRSFKEN